MFFLERGHERKHDTSRVTFRYSASEFENHAFFHNSNNQLETKWFLIKKVNKASRVKTEHPQRKYNRIWF